MTAVIQPLVATPRHYKFESLKGYILRLSEANGYHTPTIMLSGTGMTNGEMISIIPPIENLAPLFNLSIKEICRLGYQRPSGSSSAKQIWLHNHLLPTYYLNIKTSKVCTECILESGFIESFWDIKYAIACPKHNRYLIKACPACKKQLSWFRPGLLKCGCGCDLSLFKGNKLNNEAVIGLLAFLRNQLHRQPHNYQLLKQRLGFPVEHLVSLTLPELLSIIVRFENKGGHSMRAFADQSEYQEEVTLANVSQALENWPEGLYQYLNSFNQGKVSTKGFGLRKQFESFYGSLFKSDIPQEKIAFIKDAFIKFGLEKWKKAYVTHKLDSGVGQRNQVVGIYGLASALGVMTSTANRIASQELIPTSLITYNGRTRKLFDISKGVPFEASVGESFTVRKAAALLSLPVSVLKVLREQGIYQVRHIANPMAAYHELDLNAFRDKLLACRATNSRKLTDDLITFKQVMLMKAGAGIVKASFIRAILIGELLSIGSIDENIEAILFKKHDVMRFMEESKQMLLGLITVATAARQLHCDPKVVKNLYRDGMLSGNQKSNGLFINKDSLDLFNQRYVSCAAIASIHSACSARVVSLLKENLIDLHYFPRAKGHNPQPFVERKHAKFILASSDFY